MSNLKYTKDILESAAQQEVSISGVIRSLGLAPVGGNVTHIGRQLKRFNVDTSHFTGQGHRKNTKSQKRLDPASILVYDDSQFPRRKGPLIRRAMIELNIEEKCVNCGISSWLGSEIKLHVDHINGKYWDHRLENVRFLCPNCHSQTNTYSNKTR